MKQNYIRIFQNSGGDVTVQYANPSDDQTLTIETISFQVDDLMSIATELKALSDFLCDDEE